MMQRHHLALPFALALFCTGTLACGGQSAQKSANTPAVNSMGEEGPDAMADGEASPDGDDAHAQISQLFDRIGDSRKELGLSREPAFDDIESAQGRPVPQIESAQAPQSKTCKDTCRISGAICNNAELICELAEQMDGDLWASEKCGSAKASCMEASKRCSQCVGAE